MREVEKWLEYSENDYKLAHYIFYGDYQPKPYNTICNLCQQSAEKAVKSLILYCGTENGLPKSHDIRFLLNQIKDILKSRCDTVISDDIYLYSAYLSEYAIEARYPQENEITPDEAVLCIEYTEKILLWVKDILSK